MAESVEDTLRTTQLALLSLSAVCLVLGTVKPASQNRLEAAQAALRSVPDSSDQATAAILATPQGKKAICALDLPRAMSLAWLSERSKHGWLEVTLQRPAPLLATEGCFLQADKPTLELGRSICWTAAALLEGTDRGPSLLDARVLRLHAIQGGVDSDLEERVARSVATLRTKRLEVSDAVRATEDVCSASRLRTRMYSSAESEARRLAAECLQKRAALAQKQASYAEALGTLERVRTEILTQSDQLSHLTRTDTGGLDLAAEVLIGNNVRFVSISKPDPTVCRVARSAADRTEIVADCEDASSKKTGPLPKPHTPIHLDALIRSGIWSELSELTPTLAEAKLQDEISKAQFEGEVLGISFAARDALRTLWVPLGAALVYSLWLFRRLPPYQRSEQPGIWPLGSWVQAAVHLVGLVGTAVSFSWFVGATEERSLRALLGPSFGVSVLLGMAVFAHAARRRSRTLSG